MIRECDNSNLPTYSRIAQVTLRAEMQNRSPLSFFWSCISHMWYQAYTITDLPNTFHTSLIRYLEYHFIGHMNGCDDHGIWKHSCTILNIIDVARAITSIQ